MIIGEIYTVLYMKTKNMCEHNMHDLYIDVESKLGICRICVDTHTPLKCQHLGKDMHFPHDVSYIKCLPTFPHECGHV